MKNELNTLWKAVLSDLEKKVSRANFLTFVKTLHLISLEDRIATIATPSTMVMSLMEKRFQKDIKESLKNHTGEDIDVIFIVKGIPSPSHTDQKEGTLFSPLISSPEKPQTLSIGHPPRVRADYTFETFAVSSSNQLAFTAAQKVASVPTTYNPLFIYGPVGVGKTHLMHAVANHLYQIHPDRKIIYITSEEFTNEVVEAIRTNSTAQMKKRFRSASLLLIDDIQFIEGKERVQEELFHTFNTLIDNGAQICLTSDRPPEEIKKLEKRLLSRFAGGLTVDIAEPDFELKTAILLKKAEKFGYSLPIDVAKIIADRVQDVRSLEGLLLRVITHASTLNGAITIETARLAIGEAKEEQRGHIHAEDIIKTVCGYYGIKPTALKGPKREASLVKARQITMYLLKVELGLTFVEIGNLLGGRDHTTVMHGVEKIEKLVENKAKISEDIMGIRKTLNG